MVYLLPLTAQEIKYSLRASERYWYLEVFFDFFFSSSSFGSVGSRDYCVLFVFKKDARELGHPVLYKFLVSASSALLARDKFVVEK